MFKGAISALITPFKNGEIDEKSLAKIIEWQISEGINGFVPVGTTGESPTLSHEEHGRVVKLSIDVTKGRVPVIAGAGSNSTSEAVEMAKFAQQAGANGVLCVSPYYNKPSQEGLFQHFSTIANAISIPLILYNIPPRSIVDISIETMARLKTTCPNIIGVKDATGDLGRVSLQRIALGEGFNQLSGEDITALAYNANGGHGCISVISNIAPKLFSQLQAASLSGDFKTALEIQDKLTPLMQTLFVDPSPAGVKYVASKLGLCSAELRLPMVQLTKPTEKLLDAAMEHAGIA
ncbi:MAG: 4-hydroxy-tetrahydrodipicolinate synthase [Devosiaceae bacterium]|nr:4-hydroxy-tetrahydrodipicolinate synthase [Devosiaceae bacterium]